MSTAFKSKLDAWLSTVIEAGWLAALVIAPLFFNVFSSRVFEPDKISLIRTIALIMTIAWLTKFANSGDLWLPIGLHLSWNWILPVFGVNLSGFTMRLTGYSMQWKMGDIWSGGAYGPEGGILTSLALVALAFYLWKAPIHGQSAFLLRSREED